MIQMSNHQSKSETTGRVLVVDDHPSARASMVEVLRRAGHKVEACSSAVEALNLLERKEFDVIVTDLQMPGMDGLEFIRQIGQRKYGAQIGMVTAHASVDTAVQAMRLGAFDYLEKPFEADRLEQLARQALERGHLVDAGNRLENSLQGTSTMVGSSTAMRTLRERIAQVAPTDETVLITGESGTGKELVALAIHQQSGRADEPLVGLNCPVLSAQLMESELFGHERGAFTGAENARSGRFELAEGGTLLLDEVTEIDLSLQAKLLRVLQERTFERVGSSQSISADVRVLATTNRDLRKEIAVGRFREDLYFRLAVVPLAVPPLRERREDIDILVDHFLARATERLERSACTLDPSARELLREYRWPGNVRELENIVTRACILCQQNTVTADQLRPWLIDGSSSEHFGQAPLTVPHSAEEEPEDAIPVGLSLQEMERKLIEATLERYNGHRANTAKALGIGLRTLSGKLKAYGYAPRQKVMAKAG